MATIAGMIRSPNRYNPIRHANAARQRRNEVLSSMLQDGYVSKAAYDIAVTEPIRAREAFVETNDAPYFVDYVKHELAERYPPSVLTGEGLRIFTTLDVHMQKEGDRAIDDNLNRLTAQHASLRRKEEEPGAAVVPGRDRTAIRENSRDDRGPRLPRIPVQSGDTIEASARIGLQAGYVPGGAARDARRRPRPLPADDLYRGHAVHLADTATRAGRRRTFKNRFFGHVTLEFALGESLNSATARLANGVGLDRVRDMAAKLGFGDLPAYPSIVLGGIEVSPMQVARAYAVIANDGMGIQPYAVTAVVDEDGKVIEGHDLKAELVISPQLAYMMQFMLEQVINHGTGAGARTMGFTRPAAGKTGTTNDAKDAWFAGFTPNLLTVVWTGFDQKEELGLTGAQASLPAWTAFMKAATASRPCARFRHTARESSREESIR